MLDNSTHQISGPYRPLAPEPSQSHTVNVIVQSSVSRFAIDGCCELLEVANRIAGNPFYQVNVIEEADQPPRIPVNSFGQTAILFGHRHAPWRLAEPGGHQPHVNLPGYPAGSYTSATDAN